MRKNKSSILNDKSTLMFYLSVSLHKCKPCPIHSKMTSVSVKFPFSTNNLGFAKSRTSHRHNNAQVT